MNINLLSERRGLCFLEGMLAVAQSSNERDRGWMMADAVESLRSPLCPPQSTIAWQSGVRLPSGSPGKGGGLWHLRIEMAA